MELIRSKVNAYCMGVRRALDMAEKSLDGSTGPVYALGPLIHNPQVLENLRLRGLKTVKESERENIPHGATAIIRAHGVSPEIEKALTDKNIHILDATCPRVKASQKLAARAYEQGKQVFLAGDPDHGEIVGLLGYAPGAHVIANRNAARELLDNVLFNTEPTLERPALLIAQTTFSPAELQGIVDELSQMFKNLEVANTICQATAERQNALFELLEEVEALVVVGGKNSANTRRLYLLALDAGKKAVHVEQADELPAWIFKEQKVGLASGASTPDSLLKQVEQALLKL